MDRITTGLSSGAAAVRSPAAPLIIIWLASGVLSMVIPAITWNKEKNSYYNSYGYAIEYENQQREYEEAQQSNDNNGNDDGNYNYYQECAWWNWGCRKAQYEYAMYDEDGGGSNDVPVDIPGWFIFLGGQTEEMQRWEEENTGRREGSTGPTAGERFVYVWSLLMFIGILAYGVYVFSQKRSKINLTVILLLFAQFCLMTLVMAAQGMISSDDRDFEDSVFGWYGQMGVLIAYTAFWFLLFGVLFSAAFGIMALVEWMKAKKQDGEVQDSNVEMAPATGYSKYTEEEGAPANDSDGGGYDAPTVRPDATLA